MSIFKASHCLALAIAGAALPAAALAADAGGSCHATVTFTGKTVPGAASEGNAPGQTAMIAVMGFDITMDAPRSSGEFVYSYWFLEPTGNATQADSRPIRWSAANTNGSGRLKIADELGVNPANVLVDSAHNVTIKSVSCVGAG